MDFLNEGIEVGPNSLNSMFFLKTFVVTRSCCNYKKEQWAYLYIYILEKNLGLLILMKELVLDPKKSSNLEQLLSIPPDKQNCPKPTLIMFPPFFYYIKKLFIYFTNPILKHCYLLAKALVSVYLEWNLFTTLTNQSTSLHAIFFFLLNLHLHRKSIDSTYTWFGIYYFTHLWYPSSDLNNLSQFVTVKIKINK